MFNFLLRFFNATNETMLAVCFIFIDGQVVPAADLETDLHDNRQHISDEVGVKQLF